MLSKFSREGQNWDVSPQSLLSASDRSQIVDASTHLQEDPRSNIIESRGIPQLFQQTTSNNNAPTFDRLSLFFSEQDLPKSDSQNIYQVINRRLSQDSLNIPAITSRIISPANAFFDTQATSLNQNASKFQSPIGTTLPNTHSYAPNNNNQEEEDNQDDEDDSGSNLLDNIDRLSRLSGLFKDFESSNEPIQPPRQQDPIPKQQQSYQQQQQQQPQYQPYQPQQPSIQFQNILDSRNYSMKEIPQIQPANQLQLQQQSQYQQQLLHQQKNHHTLQQQQQQQHQQVRFFDLKSSQNIFDEVPQANKQKQQAQSVHFRSTIEPPNQFSFNENNKPAQQEQPNRQQQTTYQEHQNKLQQPQISQNPNQPNYPQNNNNNNNNPIIRKGSLKQPSSKQKDPSDVTANLFQDNQFKQQPSSHNDITTSTAASSNVALQQSSSSQNTKFSRLSEFFQNGKTSSSSSSSISPIQSQQQQQPQQPNETNSTQSQNKKPITEDSAEYQQKNNNHFRFSMGNLSANDFFNESKSSNESNSYLYENLDTVNRLSEGYPPAKTGASNTAASSNILQSADKYQSSSKQYSQYHPTFSPSPLADDLKNLSLDFDQTQAYENNINNHNISSSSSPNEPKKKRKNFERQQLDSIKSACIFTSSDSNSSHNENMLSLTNPTNNQQSISAAILSNPNILSEISRITNMKTEDDLLKINSQQRTPLRTPRNQNNNPTKPIIEDESSEVKAEREFERVLRRIPFNSYEKNVIFNILTPAKKAIIQSATSQQQQQIDNNENLQQNQQQRSSEELLAALHTHVSDRLERTQEEIQRKQERLKELKAIRDTNQQLLEQQSRQQATESTLNSDKNQSIQQANKENNNPLKSQKKQKSADNQACFSLSESKYWQAYKIIVHHFGFEYLGKTKSNKSKAGILSFRFLSSFLCSLEVSRAKTTDTTTGSSGFTFVVSQCFVQPFVPVNYSHVPISSSNVVTNSTQLHMQLDSASIASVMQFQLNKKYKNYASQSGNLTEIFHFVSCRINELLEFNRHMRMLSRVYLVRDFRLSQDLTTIEFSLRLTQFPDKIVRFSLHTDSWYNDISIAIQSNETTDPATPSLHASEELDKQINTSFNSKINSQSTFSKLKSIIDAINIKNTFGTPGNDTSASIQTNTSNSLP